MYQKRFYRDQFKGINLQFFDVCVLETDLRIGANKNLYQEAFELVNLYRTQLETYIKMEPNFLTSLVPIEAQSGAPLIALRMCEAASIAGVGPMAAVAGAISEMVGLGLLEYTNEVVVENGGDLFIKTCSTRKIGIYAGNSPLSGKIAVEIQGERTPLGICTSAGTVGHSLSFGKADAAMVVSKDTFLADAVATAVGNRVKAPGDIEEALDFAINVEKIDGALIIIGDKMGAIGNIKIVQAYSNTT